MDLKTKTSLASTTVNQPRKRIKAYDRPIMFMKTPQTPKISRPPITKSNHWSLGTFMRTRAFSVGVEHRRSIGRRQTQRAVLLVQVEISASGEFSIGRVQNVSEGGLLVLTHNPLDPEKEVTTRLNLPAPPPEYHIECQGVVVRIQPGSNMAIEFRQLKEEHRKAIAEFVKATLKDGV